MVSALGRFTAVVIMGVVISSLAFYFALTRNTSSSSTEERREENTSTLFEYEKFAFQYPGDLDIVQRVSPVDQKVYLIDVVSPDAEAQDPAVLRVQVLPKRTKEACDVLGGSAGNPIAVGVVNVQPCLIPRLFNNEGVGLRLEIPRDTFTVIFFSDRYDVHGDIVDAMLKTIEWRD